MIASEATHYWSDMMALTLSEETSCLMQIMC